MSWRPVLYLGLFALLVTATGLAIHPLPHLVLTHDHHDWAALTPVQRFSLENSLRTSMLQAIGGVVLVVGAITALRQLALSRRAAEEDRKAKYIDAFTRAIDQLSGDSATGQTAGVYAIERLATIYGADWAGLSPILTSFLHDGARGPASGRAVEAAVRTLSIHRVRGTKLDLRNVSLAHRHLHGLDLSNALLQGADLREANLAHSNLSSADFSGADLSRADLRAADVTNAKLENCRRNGVQTDERTKGWSDPVPVS